MARPKHRTKPEATYFVTADTWQRRSLFRNTQLAEILEAKLYEYRDRRSYLLHAYVIMPEHFHVILTPGTSTTLEKAVQLIKCGSSYRIGQQMKLKFPVWHPGFTEHQIRDLEDFESHVRYIDFNPVKAGLAERPEEYLFCSAQGTFNLDPWPVASGAEAQGVPAASLRRG